MFVLLMWLTFNAKAKVENTKSAESNLIIIVSFYVLPKPMISPIMRYINMI